MFNQNLRSWSASPGCLQTTWPGTGICTLKIQISGGYPQERVFLPTEMTIRLGERHLSMDSGPQNTPNCKLSIPILPHQVDPAGFSMRLSHIYSTHLPNAKKFSLGAAPKLDIRLNKIPHAP